MSENKDVGICVEVAFSMDEPPQYESHYYVTEDTKFSEAILQVIGRTSQNPDLELKHWLIKTGRFEKTPFFPIGASEKTMAAWRETQKSKRKVIPLEEIDLDYGKIVEKYQSTTFHISYKK